MVAKRNKLIQTGQNINILWTKKPVGKEIFPGGRKRLFIAQKLVKFFFRKVLIAVLYSMKPLKV